MMTDNRIGIVTSLAHAIYDKKGFNILTLDVRGICNLTDFFIIAEGTVDRHVRALGDAAFEKMKELGENPLHIEGSQSCDWLVLDYGDIIIHLFTPGLREKYSIERIWHEGSIIDVEF